MHLSQVAFLGLFIATLTAAFARGGRPEFQGGALLLAAALATPLLQNRMFDGVELGIAAIDVVLLCALIWLFCNSDRRWPIFAAGFQAVGVLTHLARLFAGTVHGDSYGTLLVLWSYPVLLALLWGSLVETRQDGPVAVARPSEPIFDVSGQYEAPEPAREARAPATDDLSLLSQLLRLHGLGPESQKVASELLDCTGSFGAAVNVRAAKLRSWGFDDRVAKALIFTRNTTRTSLRRRLETRLKVDSVNDAMDYLHAEMAHLPHEQFRVLYLNARNRLIHDAVHGEGTVNAAPVYPREVIRHALENGAVNLILAHNHPSGDPSPSRDDIVMTKALMEAGRHVGVSVIDHIVVGTAGAVSMRSIGLI